VVELERRRLGRTEMRPRALALGCAHLGRADRADAVAVDTVRRAIELGIDYVDTSPAYGDSERKLGLALEGGWREKVFLQTKTGTHPARRGDYSAAGTRWSVENSLRLLKTDYLDAVLIHDPDDIEAPLAPGACLDELLKLKSEGLVRHIGLGCREHHFHQRAIETGAIEIVLTYLDYTLLDQSVARTTFPLARQYDVGLQLGTVMALGRLNGEEPKPEDTRAHAMWAWCRQRGLNLRHLAIQFTLHAPVESIVVIGAGTRRHLEEAYADATTPIAPEVWQEFRAQFGVGV
jgi:aryl-alcohol dehydrogenase-like predicted oxidoreductase